MYSKKWIRGAIKTFFNVKKAGFVTFTAQKEGESAKMEQKIRNSKE